MGENTKIEWAHHTANFWRGCTKISAGCANCYAEQLSKRNPATLGIWGDNGTRVIAAESYWKQPLKWNRWALDGTCYRCSGKGSIRIAKTLLEGGEPVVVKVDEQCQTCAGQGNIGRYRARVFCASLADVFEDRSELIEPRARLFRLIFDTPNLDWLLLTKRPQMFAPLVTQAAGIWARTNHADYEKLLAWMRGQWFPSNVWIGTSVENQEQADKRIPDLLKVPAAVRFLSCEPLLGPVDLEGISHFERLATGSTVHTSAIHRIDWVIVGGESGLNARPMHPDWARSLRDQCQAAGVAFHFKQWGEWGDAPGPVISRRLVEIGDKTMYQIGKKAAGRFLDDRTWDELPTPAIRV